MPKAYVAPSLRLPHTMGYSELVTPKLPSLATPELLNAVNF